MTERAVVIAGKVAEATAIFGALVVLSGAAFLAPVPPLEKVALFAALLVWAENAAVLLPGNIRISPSFMVAMASITAFEGQGVVLGAALVGAAGGVILRGIKLRRWRILAFNCGQYALASASAAGVHYGVTTLTDQRIAAVVLSAAAFAAVNFSLVLPATASDSGVPLRRLWAETLPTLPNFLAFGFLGTLIGMAEARFGALVVLLLVAPLVVARSVFIAFRRQSDAYARLRRLYEFSRSVAEAGDLTHTASTALDEARSLAGAARARLLLRTGDRVVRIERTGDEPVALAEVDVAELTDDERALLDGEMRAGPGSLAAPLEGLDGTAGAIVIEGEDMFAAEDRELFSTFAHQTAAALQRAQLVEQLRHESLHDALTGLANRTLFQARVEAAAGLPAAALLLVDVDGFKAVNETLGPAHGDGLLVSLASRLRALFPDSATVARLGGDEFGLVLPSTTDREAERIAVRILDALEQPFSIAGVQFEVSASVGIACAPHDGADTHTLQHRANVALGSAKARHCGWSRYVAEDDNFSPRRLSLAGDLRRALDERQLRLHYQPLVDPATGTVEAVEALIRWRHPVHGELPPSEFIPIAEHTPLVHPLTRSVIEMAAQQAASWRRQGHSLPVAVNLSARSLGDQTLPARLAIALEQWNLPAEALTVELTETAVMADADRSIEVLREVRALGVRVAIDDFGTGYSSLAYLKHLPVDELKIDRSLVSQLTASSFDERIVGSVIELGVDLGLTVVAEGVEDDATRRQLVRLGCPLVQGYLFSPAVAATEIVPLLTAGRSR